MHPTLLNMLSTQLAAERLEDAQRRWRLRMTSRAPSHAAKVPTHRECLLVTSGRPEPVKSWQR